MPTTSVWRRLAHGLRMLAVLLLLAALAGIAWVSWYLSASQPPTAGQFRVAGADGRIEILRDAEGIPSIHAETLRDAYLGLGFAHAQDRLWQMEMQRRVASGRLSEWLGSPALDIDRFMRTLGLSRHAGRVHYQLAPETRELLDAYAAGVNAWIEQRNVPLPPEFLLIGRRPEAWTAIDSLAIQSLLAWDLSGNWHQELLRFGLAQRLPLARINQLLAPHPGDAPLPLADYPDLYRRLGLASAAAMAANALLAQAPAPLQAGEGSNNWVIAPVRSRSGAALIANDPHLGLSAPSLWYLAHLRAPGLNVSGGTVPGLPAVLIGRNADIAWALTNTGPDVIDLYLEALDPADAQRYRTPDGHAAFEQHEERIRVRGQADVRLTVRHTRHGPVVSDVSKSAADALANMPGGAGHVLALQWTGLRDDDLTTQAALRLNRAHDWDSFRSALRDWHTPMQSVLYADIRGQIGMLAPGRVPRRQPDNDLFGQAPAPGWERRYDWNGFLDFDELPQVRDPDAGWIATANQRIVPPDWPHFLTRDWAPPWRYQRIEALIESRPLHDLESLRQIQADVRSEAMRALLPLMLTRLKADGDPVRLTPAQSAAVQALVRWDGSMQSDRPEPLLASAWIEALSSRLLRDDLGDALYERTRYVRFKPAFLREVLQAVGPVADWCDDVRTAPQESCEAQVQAAWRDAWTQCSTLQGRDWQRWQWGRSHQAWHEHRPMGKVPGLGAWFDIRHAVSGDTDTVFATWTDPLHPRQPFASFLGPGLRMRIDMAETLQGRGRSRFIHATGQSGHPASADYRRFTARWAAVSDLPMRAMDPPSATGSAQRRTVLTSSR